MQSKGYIHVYILGEILLTCNVVKHSYINGNENYVMCYPYGSYNEHTLKVCEKQGFDLGLTTNDGTFDAKTDHSLEIKRKDTNCFPKAKSF